MAAVLRARRGNLQRVVGEEVAEVLGDPFAERQVDAPGVIDEKAQGLGARALDSDQVEAPNRVRLAAAECSARGQSCLVRGEKKVGQAHFSMLPTLEKSTQYSSDVSSGGEPCPLKHFGRHGIQNASGAGKICLGAGAATAWRDHAEAAARPRPQLRRDPPPTALGTTAPAAPWHLRGRQAGGQSPRALDGGRAVLRPACPARTAQRRGTDGAGALSGAGSRSGRPGRSLSQPAWDQAASPSWPWVWGQMRSENASR